MTLIDLQKKMLCCFDDVKKQLSDILTAILDPVLKDYGSELALGNIENRYTVSTFGVTETLSQGSSTQDLWTGIGVYTGHPANFTPELVTVSSDDANDTLVGTGAQIVRIFGLETETSTEYTREDIELDGATLVDSAKTWWRVNRVAVRRAGSSGINIGKITVASKVTTVNVFDVMKEGLNQSQLSAWTVPAESIAILKRVNMSLIRSNGQDGSAAIALEARVPNGVFLSNAAFLLAATSSISETAFAGITYPAGTDLKLGFIDISDNNTTGQGTMEFEVVKNS